MTRSFAALALLALTACRCAPSPGPAGEPDAGAAPRAVVPCPLPPEAAAKVGDVPVDLDLRFEAAMRAFDAAWEGHRDEEALACAQEACRSAPDDEHAHLDRALALDQLGQAHDAHLAFGRALALAPDDPEILRQFGDFLFRDGSDDALETALALARRGRETATEVALGAELAALEAASANALGRPTEGLSAAETALALDSDLSQGHVERGIALFELLRFAEAEATLAEAIRLDPEDARAHHFAGLVAERRGRPSAAEEFFKKAATLDPEAFPLALDFDRDAFEAVFRAEREALAEADRARLSATQLGWEDLPALEDLRAGEPQLSPTIIGLFRPGEEGRPDAVVLYRQNLLRLCRTPEELHREVRDTLLHELGHMAGESDAELRDRGL